MARSVEQLRATHLDACRYALYGLSIRSVVALPGARPDESAEPVDVNVVWQSAEQWDTSGWPITHAASSPSHADICQATDGSVLLAWGDRLRFVISPAHDVVTIVASAEMLPYAGTVLVGFGFGYLLQLRGVLCLHAAVLAREGRAFALLGASRAGKSTLAAALVHRGAALVSDDLLVVRNDGDALHAQPGCAAMRVDPAAIRELFGMDESLFEQVPHLNKRLWNLLDPRDQPPGRFLSHALPIDAIYVLDCHDAGQPELGPVLSATDSLRQLLSAWYPPGHMQLLTQARLRDLRALAAAHPLRVVRQVRQWAQLPRLVDLLSA
jgi:hypothetical protein